ncbi:MAG: T9SS type A sorting domain-containing protein [Bacteroidota bacterium]
MKKYFLLICSIFFLARVSFAQKNEFAPIGAKWWYSVNIWGPPVGGIGCIKIEVLRDTIIKGKVCRILGSCFLEKNSPNDYNYTTLLYDSSGVVFWYMPAIDSFVTLYNFNANKGDTWFIKIITSYCNATVTIKVDSVNYKIINNQTLKVLYLRNINTDKYWLSGATAERIGNIRWLFPILSGRCGFDESNYLFRCYEDTALGLYKVDSTLELNYTWNTPCDTTWWYTGIKKPFNNNPVISVYPTLCDEYLTIQLNDFNLYYPITYKIYNLLGQMVHEGKINNYEQKINVKTLNNNMYFINILFEKAEQSFKYYFIKN